MTNKATLCILYRDEAVEAVFLDRTVLGVRIKASERLPRNDEVFAAVAGLMQGAGKMPSRVVLCIPRAMAMQRTLRYPVLVQADLANMVQYEATRHVPLPEGDRALAWASVPSSDGKQVVLNLLAVRQSELRALVERFEAAGVPIDEAVPFSSSIVSLVGATPTLLAISDDRLIELALYGEGQLQDSQTLPRNAPGFSPERVATAARQMAAKHKEWLGDEGIGRIITAGPQPLEADLASAFGLHVRPLEFPEGVDAAAGVPADAVCAALALLPPQMNLLEARGRKVPVSRRTLAMASLCALLAIELVAGFAVKTAAPSIQRRQVAEELAKVRRRAAPIQRMQEKNREMRRQLYRLEELCGQHVGTMEILLQLSEALPDDTYLRSLSIDDGQGIRLRGLSKAPERLPELLMAHPMVEAISTAEIEKKVDDYHEFSLSVTLKGSDEDDV